MQFNEEQISSYYFKAINKLALSFRIDGGYPYTYGKCDFLTGVLYIGSSESAGGTQGIAFSQLNPKTLAFLHAKLKELGGTPPPLFGKEGEEWSRIGNTGIAQTTTCPDINHKLTNVFNFVSRQMVTLTENLSTRAESSATPVSFDDLPDSVLTEALEKFAELGGKTDETFVLKGKSSLPKNKLG